MAIPRWNCKKCGSKAYHVRIIQTTFTEYHQPAQDGRPYYWADDEKKTDFDVFTYFCRKCGNQSKVLEHMATWGISKEEL